MILEEEQASTFANSANRVPGIADQLVAFDN